MTTFAEPKTPDLSAHTPMMRQYLLAKHQNPNCMVVFRLGDFFELFYEDAQIAARVCDLTLTHRGQSAGEKILMAGVPAHTLDQYLVRLVKAGYSVAICDQVEEAGPGVKLVNREVTRIVTPGTLTDDALLEQHQENTLVALCQLKQRYGIASIALSSGHFVISEHASLADLNQALRRLSPTELLLPESFPEASLSDLQGIAVTRCPPWEFDLSTARRLLLTHFQAQDLSGYGCESMTAALAAAGCAFGYVQTTQKRALTHIQSLQVERSETFLHVDEATLRNLELLANQQGRKAATLLSVLDDTATAMGSRLLRRQLSRPIRDQTLLNQRYDAIEALLSCYTPISSALEPIGDLERIMSRVALKSAKPRDLAALRAGLNQLPIISQLFQVHGLEALVCAKDLSPQPELAELLTSALVEQPPALLKDGGVIATGFHSELDEYRSLTQDSSQALIEIENRERERTGLSTLKVGYNRVHGYYIEVSRAQSANAPVEYTRRQTLKNVERYITPELKTFEEKVISAQHKALTLEKAIYDQLLETLIEQLAPLQALARALAELDVFATLAKQAEALNLVRPTLSTTPGINIEAGRHLVVEHCSEGPFTPNNTVLNDSERMLLITGPNMGGKSTYMRQTALIVLMAHAGCFVPAQQATIGPIDQLFSRIGAGDDLSGGRSTFMVEMSETANILNNATQNSLVLLDEIGRGTSTYDGLSLAWATAVYLTEKTRAMTLFSTHYFELTQLAGRYPSIMNVHLSAIEQNENIVFLHAVKPGPANRSYGLHVARLAGLPKAVLKQAGVILNDLTARDPNLAAHGQGQLPLSDQVAPEVQTPPKHLTLIEQLTTLNLDELSPRDALNTLYKLKTILEE